MTKKFFYIVYAANYYNNDSYYADVLKISSLENVAHKLEIIGGLLHANICATKKDAEQVKYTWNEQYKKNGTYAFDIKGRPCYYVDNQKVIIGG